MVKAARHAAALAELANKERVGLANASPSVRHTVHTVRLGFPKQVLSQLDRNGLYSRKWGGLGAAIHLMRYPNHRYPFSFRPHQRLKNAKP